MNDKFDFSKLIQPVTLPAVATLRQQERDMSKMINEINESKAQKEADEYRHRQVVEGGINNQIELLTQQLEQEKLQNEQLKNNYDKLDGLYKLKEKELEESHQESLDSKKYNRKMFWIALGAGLFALGSLIANVIMISLML